MDLNRFCVKFLARSGSEIDDSTLIPIFHEWIRDRKLGGTLLDVVDYRHVPEGPGIMLITHEINYAMDRGDGQFGLYAQRKLGVGETFQERLLDLVKQTAIFGKLLESDNRLSNKVQLKGETFVFISNDRLALPNTREAFDSVKPVLEAVAMKLYGNQQSSVSYVETEPRARLTALIESPGTLSIASVAA